MFEGILPGSGTPQQAHRYFHGVKPSYVSCLLSTEVLWVSTTVLWVCVS